MMQFALDWVAKNPTLFALVIWPLITAALNFVFKARTDAEYAALPSWAAFCLRFIRHLGVDAGPVLKALWRALEGDKPMPGDQ